MTISAVRVPSLTQAVPIVDDQGNPTPAFLQAFNNSLTQIIVGLNGAIAAINAQAAADAANAAAATANAAAATANTAATTAQSSANAAAMVAKLTASGVTGCTITAADVGANCTATITNHTRVYGDGTSHAVTGGTVTGLSYSTKYFIYYDDPTFAASSVTYLATTAEGTAAQTGNRHLVGVVTTPAALGSFTTGVKVDIPGIGNITLP